MPYQIEFSQKARKDIRKIPKKQLIKISEAIDELAEEPRPTGCKTLQGEHNGCHRIRIGDYRVIYQIQDDVIEILVLRIASRGAVY